MKFSLYLFWSLLELEIQGLQCPLECRRGTASHGRKTYPAHSSAWQRSAKRWPSLGMKLKAALAAQRQGLLLAHKVNPSSTPDGDLFPFVSKLFLAGFQLANMNWERKWEQDFCILRQGSSASHHHRAAWPPFCQAPEGECVV